MSEPFVSVRSRVAYLALLIAIIGVGLPTRLAPQIMPYFMVQYGGDALWALAIFLGFGLLFPQARTRILVIASLIVTWGIEFSELYQADWINAIRATLIGGLILGHTFLWSDLVCYSVGIGAGVLVDNFLFLKHEEVAQ